MQKEVIQFFPTQTSAVPLLHVEYDLLEESRWMNCRSNIEEDCFPSAPELFQSDARGILQPRVAACTTSAICERCATTFPIPARASFGGASPPETWQACAGFCFRCGRRTVVNLSTAIGLWAFDKARTRWLATPLGATKSPREILSDSYCFTETLALALMDDEDSGEDDDGDPPMEVSDVAETASEERELERLRGATRSLIHQLRLNLAVEFPPADKRAVESSSLLPAVCRNRNPQGASDDHLQPLEHHFQFPPLSLVCRTLHDQWRTTE